MFRSIFKHPNLMDFVSNQKYTLHYWLQGRALEILIVCDAMSMSFRSRFERVWPKDISLCFGCSEHQNERECIVFSHVALPSWHMAEDDGCRRRKHDSLSMFSAYEYTFTRQALTGKRPSGKWTALVANGFEWNFPSWMSTECGSAFVKELLSEFYGCEWKRRYI